MFFLTVCKALIGIYWSLLPCVWVLQFSFWEFVFGAGDVECCVSFSNLSIIVQFLAIFLFRWFTASSYFQVKYTCCVAVFIFIFFLFHAPFACFFIRLCNQIVRANVSLNYAQNSMEEIDKYFFFWPIKWQIFNAIFVFHFSYSLMNLMNVASMCPSAIAFGTCELKILRIRHIGLRCCSPTRRIPIVISHWGAMEARSPSSPRLCPRPVEVAWSVQTGVSVRNCTRSRPSKIFSMGKLKHFKGKRFVSWLLSREISRFSRLALLFGLMMQRINF